MKLTAKLTAPDYREKQLRHQSVIKESNIKSIFDLIYENEGISRSEISRRMNMSRSAVSVLVDELVNSGLVCMSGTGTSAASGRKPIRLEINRGYFQIITVSLRKETFRAALWDLGGNEVESLTRKAAYKRGFGNVMRKTIVNKFRQFNEKKLIALCVSIPAKINIADKSVELFILNIQKGCDMLGELKAVMPGVPLVVGNRSSAHVYAEHKYNPAARDGDIIYFFIDEGVAAGIIFNGKVFTGEIGHMSIDANGPLCSCGKQGCLENMVSRASIEREFGGLSYEAIRKALDAGGPVAVKTAGELARKIGFGISNVVCMFSPKRIILGGGIEELGPVFLEMILKNVRFPGGDGSQSPIAYSALGRDSDSGGILSYFMDNIFSITTEIENTIYGWN
jgi:predicted NBD/HSP70 family sugar kinase